MSSTTSGTSAIFSGSSRYSSDFQQIITRAVSIASLPLTQLTNQKNDLTDQQTALASLDTRFTSLQTALNSLSAATTNNSANVADPTVASANVTSQALAGTFKITVNQLGSVTQTLSKDTLTKVTNPSTQSISTASSFTLTVDGKPLTITPASNSLLDLTKAINLSGAPVQAVLVNLGPPSQPDYRLSIQGTKLASTSIQLKDGTTDLLNPLTTGSPLTYQVNGQPTGSISSDSRSVTIEPGLTVNLLGQGTTNVVVSKSEDDLGSALASFVNAFNATVDELDTHRGQGTGVLKGQGIVSQLSNTLSKLGSYSGGTSGISSLASIGITFDKTGHLGFDQTAFQTAVNGNVDALNGLLGSTTSGGFLQAASTALNSVEDSTNGTIQTALTSVNSQITRQGKLISDEQDKVNFLQQNLTNQMAAADAAIAVLEQQVTYLTGLFSTMTGNTNK